MQMRIMDELFSVERNVGEICGVVCLLSDKQPTTFEVTSDMIEEPVEEEEQKVAPKLDEEGNEIPAEEN